VLPLRTKIQSLIKRALAAALVSLITLKAHSPTQRMQAVAWNACASRAERCEVIHDDKKLEK
jgi:hypothetical protein